MGAATFHPLLDPLPLPVLFELLTLAPLFTPKFPPKPFPNPIFMPLENPLFIPKPLLLLEFDELDTDELLFRTVGPPIVPM